MDRRFDALGDLRVLPDEIVCGIFEYLSPRDLALLSCVSSVTYILCNEEPMWMSLCLRDGGQLQYKGSWKKTTLYRQNLCTALEMSREKPLQFYGFNSLFLYRRWYRCFTSLDVFSFDTGILDRKKDLTLEEFRLQYDGKQPILLTELTEAWPARKKWTKNQLLLTYGEVAFRISQRSSKKISMKFKDYVSYMELQHDEDPLYIFDDKFGEVAPTLLEDYSVPHLFREDFFDVLDSDQRPPFRWLIIGPERSGASWHVDPALTSAWNTLLLGRKRWALYPPGRVPVGVTVHVNEEDGDANIDSPSSLQWWLDVYPHLADSDKPIECTQLPGETIFVPSGWWHCVLNLETTVAVTQNFVNTSNFEYTCLDMAPGHRHKGVCRAGLLAIKDSGFEDAKNGTSLDTSSLNYPDMSRKEKRLKVLGGDKKLYSSESSWNDINGLPDICNKLHGEEFSYNIDFLAKFLETDRDHYTCAWSPSNCIGPREMRQWLHRLWVSKPAIRQLIWKGACLALNVDRWSTCAMEICAFHNLPSPKDDEKFPVGTGSNPVFLISDYVVKVCVEGGLSSSVHGLGTELEFYSLLHKVRSPLVYHVPEVVASGMLVNENGVYKPLPWDGRGIPDILANCELNEGDCRQEDFPFGLWRKKKFELRRPDSISHSNIWPYIVTKRCKGDIFAHLRDALPQNVLLRLASFLGDQLRSLHLLPLPPYKNDIQYKVNDLFLMRRFHNDSVDVSEKPAANLLMEVINKASSAPSEWEPVIATLNRRRKNLKDRLSQWGDPIPGFLIEKVEEYIPHDLALLFHLSEDDNGLPEHIGLPAWIHSDIMDDNIHMESCSHSNSSGATASGVSPAINAISDACKAEGTLSTWLPTHILDFSDLTVGDPLLDLIPIYLDVFRGVVYLLKQLLKSYRLPLARTMSHVHPCGVEKWKNFKKISYRAMCFCILHEENILGAIFSLWKDLRKVRSWEEVEEGVWGELNNYRCAD